MGSRFVAAFITALLCATGAWAECRAGQVHIRGDFGQARFSVEVADTVVTRNRGLMFRETLPASAGMLFVYPAPKNASFWMKNTPLPLDMIFADREGRVTRIHENAVPFDLTLIDGGPGVQFVLEINGGLSRMLGIQPGAEMRHPAISSDTAAWPC